MADEKTAEQFGISSNTLRKDMKTPDLTIIPKNIKSPILAIIPLKQQGTVIYMATKEGPHLAGTKQGWNGSI